MKSSTNSKRTIAAIIIGVVVLCGIYFVSIFNKEVNLNNDVKTAWGNVEVQYQRRADLIKSLVPIVKEASTSEGEILEKALAARYTNSTTETPNPAEVDRKESEFSSAISKLSVVIERYPDLKSQGNFANLMGQVEGSENRIQAARTDFNNSVKNYNNFVEKFPVNILGKDSKDSFKSQEGSESAPQIDFNR